MYEFQDRTPISGHFRTNFKISGISGQRPGLLNYTNTLRTSTSFFDELQLIHTYNTNTTYNLLSKVSVGSSSLFFKYSGWL